MVYADTDTLGFAVYVSVCGYRLYPCVRPPLALCTGHRPRAHVRARAVCPCLRRRERLAHCWLLRWSPRSRQRVPASDMGCCMQSHHNPHASSRPIPNNRSLRPPPCCAVLVCRCTLCMRTEEATDAIKLVFRGHGIGAEGRRQIGRSSALRPLGRVLLSCACRKIFI